MLSLFGVEALDIILASFFSLVESDGGFEAGEVKLQRPVMLWTTRNPRS